jgi:glucuronate isomerase
MNVETVCTTDDPSDSLEYHQRLHSNGSPVKIIPAWRPDRVLAAGDPTAFNVYLNDLAQVSDQEIESYPHLILALEKRHDYFHAEGCRLSDHGLENFYAADYNARDINVIFKRLRTGNNLAPAETDMYRSAILYDLAVMDHDKGWTQQFHIGALRNNNTRMFYEKGPDAGYDSIGDFPVALPMARFLDRLEICGKLAKTIIYNLNPADNDVIAAMIGNFQDASLPGKIQWGSGWWFNDQKDGIEAQLKILSNHGLLSRFVGMLTDSRSFLSYPRHEYFRRILCNLIGLDVENGELPDDKPLLAKLVKDISYNNARNYFNFGT